MRSVSYCTPCILISHINQLCYFSPLLLLTLLFLLLNSSITSAATSSVNTNDTNNAKECHWTTRPDDPIIHYINLDNSKMRRQEMESQLQRMGVRYERFAGIDMAQIHIPEDIVSTWNTKQGRCRFGGL